MLELVFKSGIASEDNLNLVKENDFSYIVVSPVCVCLCKAGINHRLDTIRSLLQLQARDITVVVFIMGLNLG